MGKRNEEKKGEAVRRIRPHGNNVSPYLTHPTAVYQVCYDLDAKHGNPVLLTGPRNSGCFHIFDPGICGKRDRKTVVCAGMSSRKKWQSSVIIHTIDAAESAEMKPLAWKNSNQSFKRWKR